MEAYDANVNAPTKAKDNSVCLRKGRAFAEFSFFCRGKMMFAFPSNFSLIKDH